MLDASSFRRVWRILCRCVLRSFVLGGALVSAPKFSRQHYIVIAEALRKACEYAISDSNKTACRAAAECVANSLANDNPRFNREHFLAVVRGERDLNSRPSRNGKAGAR